MRRKPRTEDSPINKIVGLHPADSLCGNQQHDNRIISPNSDFMGLTIAPILAKTSTSDSLKPAEPYVVLVNYVPLPISYQSVTMYRFVFLLHSSFPLI